MVLAGEVVAFLGVAFFIGVYALLFLQEEKRAARKRWLSEHHVVLLADARARRGQGRGRASKAAHSRRA